MSNIYLGNVSIEEMEQRLGITIPGELKEYLINNHEPNATTVEKGKWHCFDIPFMLAVGDMETAQMIISYLKPLSEQIKEPMQIAVYNNKKS